jgi:hypothetical protein
VLHREDPNINKAAILGSTRTIAVR